MRRTAAAIHRTTGPGARSLLIVGDSQTDPLEPHVPVADFWPYLLAGVHLKIVARGGATTRDLVQRVQAIEVDDLIVFAGINDAAFGLDPSETEFNTAAILARVRAQRRFVVSANYRNFTIDGDRPDEPRPRPAAVRDATRRAAGHLGATYVDLYAQQRGMIIEGTVPDFSREPYDPARSWHVADSDQHHNRYGHRIVYEMVSAALAAG